MDIFVAASFGDGVSWPKLSKILMTRSEESFRFTASEQERLAIAEQRRQRAEKTWRGLEENDAASEEWEKEVEKEIE